MNILIFYNKVNIIFYLYYSYEKFLIYLFFASYRIKTLSMYMCNNSSPEYMTASEGTITNRITYFLASGLVFSDEVIMTRYRTAASILCDQIHTMPWAVYPTWRLQSPMKT